MNGRSILYGFLLGVAMVAGLAAYAAGAAWPDLNEVMRAHAKEQIFVLTPCEVTSTHMALIMWRVERGANLIALACAAAAFVVSLRNKSAAATPDAPARD